MKKLSWLILLFCIAGCTKAVVVTPPPPINPDFTIDTNFQYNFADFAPCVGAVTTSCVKSFAWGFVTGVPVKTVPITAFFTAAGAPITCPATLPSPPDLTCVQPANAQGFSTLVDFGNSTLPVGGTGDTIWWQATGVDVNGNTITATAVLGNTLVVALGFGQAPQWSYH
jgi:hypothetical protein